MISGRMLWGKSFISMPLAMLTTGLLLQLLLLGTTKVVAQVAIEPTQPPPPPVPPVPPQPSETISIILSTISTRSTTPKSTVTTRTTTTTDFIECDIRKSGPSGGAIAGIVIGVLIVYIVSLILVAILASVLTKRGTIDLSRWKIFRVASNGNNDKASKDSNTELAEPNDYTDEMHSSPAGVYAALDGRTRVETPAEPSPYEALQMHGGHKNRNAKKKPRIKKKPTSTVPQETDVEKPMATVPQEATDDEIYQNY